jgi:hypothetical protein
MAADQTPLGKTRHYQVRSVLLAFQGYVTVRRLLRRSSLLLHLLKKGMAKSIILCYTGILQLSRN